MSWGGLGCAGVGWGWLWGAVGPLYGGWKVGVSTLTFTLTFTLLLTPWKGGSNRKNVAVSPNYEAIDGSLERYDPVEAIGAIIQCLLEGIITDAR